MLTKNAKKEIMERFDLRTNGANNRRAESDAHAAVRKAEAPVPPRAEQSAPRKNAPSKRKLWVALAVIFGILLIAGAFYLFRSSMSGAINSKYQAVFLSNGQVYFGKLQAVNSEYVKVTNVYYIQNAANSAAENANDANNIELIRLTKAVHGPKDEVVINRDQLMYFENLEEEGQAAKLIASDNANK